MQRSRERAAFQRVGVVGVLLAVLVLVVPSLGPPRPTADSVMRRMVEREQDRIAQLAQVRDDSALGEERPRSGTQLEAAAPLVPVTQAAELFVPIGRLEVPKVGLVADVRSGVHDRILEQGVGHWPGTLADNMVFSGHRTTYGHPFRDLDLLAPGDQLFYFTGAAPPTAYAVFETVVVPEAEYVNYVLSGTPEPDDRVLTLYACHPKGSRTHRIVVRARAVEAQVAGQAPAGPGGPT